MVINSNQLDSSAVSHYPIYLDYVNCMGSETNLLRCYHRGAGVHRSNAINKVAVRCSKSGNCYNELLNYELFVLFISGGTTFDKMSSESQLSNELFLAIADRSLSNVRSLLQTGVDPDSIIDKCCLYNEGSPALVCAVSAFFTFCASSITKAYHPCFASFSFSVRAIP